MKISQVHSTNILTSLGLIKMNELRNKALLWGCVNSGLRLFLTFEEGNLRELVY